MAFKKGYVPSEEHRRKLSEAHKGQTAWNKGKKGLQSAWNKGKPLSEQSKKKLSESLKGRTVWNKGKKGLQTAWNKGKKGLQTAWNKGKKLPSSWNKGKHWSEESIKKMSEAHKQALANPELRKRMSEASKKALSNPEIRKKMSEAHKGQVAWNKGISPSEESIKKQKATYNKTLLANPEIRTKMSESQKGKKRSKEALRKFSLSMQGHKVSEETRRKISLAQIGKFIPEETRKKISESTKKGMAKAKESGKHLGREKGFISWNKGKKLGKNPEHSKRMKGRAPPNKGVPMREDVRIKMIENIRKRLSNPEERKKLSERTREQILKQYESGAFPKQVNTKPEREIRAELIKRGYKEGIDFIHQYKFMNKFMCDFCFPEQKIVVECDGDYWHANPKKYPLPIHKQQIKDIGRDKSKDAYIRTVDNHSWALIRLWESDIKKDVKVEVDKIEEQLKKSKK